MSFAWPSFLDLARELDHRDEEACKRSAVSRAYYAAFQVTKAYMQRCRPDLPLRGDGRDHDLWKDLLRNGKGAERRIGRLGDDLKKWRRDADYEPIASNWPETSKQAIAAAETILKLIEPAG